MGMLDYLYKMALLPFEKVLVHKIIKYKYLKQ